jgi:hypothetical protein
MASCSSGAALAGDPAHASISQICMSNMPARTSCTGGPDGAAMSMPSSSRSSRASAAPGSSRARFTHQRRGSRAHHAPNSGQEELSDARSARPCRSWRAGGNRFRTRPHAHRSGPGRPPARPASARSSVPAAMRRAGGQQHHGTTARSPRSRQTSKHRANMRPRATPEDRQITENAQVRGITDGWCAVRDSNPEPAD